MTTARNPAMMAPRNSRRLLPKEPDTTPLNLDTFFVLLPLVALRKVIAVSDATKKRWEFTWQNNSGADGNRDLREELLCTEEIQCFAMAQKSTLVVSIVHGLRKCYFTKVSSAVKGKVLGILGEWTAEARSLSW
jgi:hypothetical protein